MAEGALAMAERVSKRLCLEGNTDAARAISVANVDLYQFAYGVEALAHELSHAVTLGITKIEHRIDIQLGSEIRRLPTLQRHLNECATLAAEVNVLRALDLLPCRRGFLQTQLDVIKLRLPKTTLECRLLSRSYGRKAKRDAARVLRIIEHLDAQPDPPPWEIRDVP